MNESQHPARWWEVAIGWTLFALVALLVSFPKRRLRKSQCVVIENREAA